MNEETPQREVLQHIARPDLPWRAATRTRCGREIDELAVGRVIGVEEAAAKWKRLGQQRASLFLCMTCCNHVSDWPEWKDSPQGLNQLLVEARQDHALYGQDAIDVVVLLIEARAELDRLRADNQRLLRAVGEQTAQVERWRSRADSRAFKLRRTREWAVREAAALDQLASRYDSVIHTLVPVWGSKTLTGLEQELAAVEAVRALRPGAVTKEPTE